MNAFSLSYDTTLQEIKQLPIIDIFRHYVGGELRISGNRAYAQCFIHEDRNPSLTIYQNSNSWYCFSCQAGGDGIDLVRYVMNLSFKEAVQTLAADFGIILPEAAMVADQAVARAKAKKLIKRRQLEDAYLKKENEVYQRLTDRLRRICSLVDSIRTEDDLIRVGDFCHTETRLEYVVETFRTGTPEERLAVLQSGFVRGLLK